MLKYLSVFTSVVVLLSLLGSHAWAQITEFNLPNPDSGPVTLIVGPDGNLWFTHNGLGSNGIARFNLADSMFTEIPVSDPRYITVGPDGKL